MKLRGLLILACVFLVVCSALGAWGVSVYRHHLRELHEREGYDAPWVCGTNERGPELRLGFIGDSITFQASYRGSAAQICAEKISRDLRRPVKLVKCGTPSSKTFDWLPDGPLFQDAMRRFSVAHVDWVCVELTTNDAYHGVGAETHVANLTTICNAIRAAGMRPVLNEPPPLFVDPKMSDRLSALVVLDQKLCRAGVAMAGESDAPDFFRNNPLLIGDDRVHPTDAGTVALGELWAAGLERVISNP